MLISYASLIKHFIYEMAPSLTKRAAIFLYKRRLNRVHENAVEYREQNGKWPLFDAVEIETINRCNNVCPFCPVNKNNDIRAFHKMSEKLFQKIIDELSELNYSGSVSLFSNNEPLLDERIEDFAEYARKSLPRAFIQVFTNGILLTEERFRKIVPSLDLLYIDNYNDKLKMIRPVRQIAEYLKHNPEYKAKVTVHLRKYNEQLFTRAGNAPNRKGEVIEPFAFGCILPLTQMVVRPDGKVSLCCNDAFGQSTMGDVNEQRLEAIWQSEQYGTVRSLSITGGRMAMGKICAKCDSVV